MNKNIKFLICGSFAVMTLGSAFGSDNELWNQYCSPPKSIPEYDESSFNLVKSFGNYTQSSVTKELARLYNQCDEAIKKAERYKKSTVKFAGMKEELRSEIETIKKELRSEIETIKKDLIERDVLNRVLQAENDLLKKSNEEKDARIKRLEADLSLLVKSTSKIDERVAAIVTNAMSQYGGSQWDKGSAAPSNAEEIQTVGDVPLTRKRR
ncbi:MAG: hypothetical protein HEEMFOPI_00217 [Holosporales bacterium]